MKELNLCLMSSCKGFCCQDICLETTNTERKRIFPHAVKVNNLKEFYWMPKNMDVVCYRRLRNKRIGSEGFSQVMIIGKCPNLNDDGNCLIHEERSHAARNLQMGSELCNQIRSEHNLPSLPWKEQAE